MSQLRRTRRQIARQEAKAKLQAAKRKPFEPFSQKTYIEVVDGFIEAIEEKHAKKPEQYYLFLDDIRTPEQAYAYTKNEIFIKNEWVIVRNYQEFVTYIKFHGIPFFVSFDHDLADSHYTPEHLWDDYHASKAWQDSQTHTEKTGLDCAKWLIQHTTRQTFPQYYCHSQNPVGKDRILGEIHDFLSRGFKF